MKAGRGLGKTQECPLAKIVQEKRKSVRKPMVRGRQAAWIIVATGGIAFLGWGYLESHDSFDPYSQCKSVFSGDVSQCRSKVAVELSGWR